MESDAERTRSDGRVEVVPKGTITLLKEWLDSQFRFPDPKPKEEMIHAFKMIRRRRQQPAHTIENNFFNPALFSEQRDIITQAYRGIRTLRLILKNHPRLHSFEVADWLNDGRIWPQ